MTEETYSRPEWTVTYTRSATGVGGGIEAAFLAGVRQRVGRRWTVHDGIATSTETGPATFPAATRSATGVSGGGVVRRPCRGIWRTRRPSFRTYSVRLSLGCEETYSRPDCRDGWLEVRPRA